MASTNTHPPSGPRQRPRRRSSASNALSAAASSLSATAKQVESKLTSTLLVLWDDLPAWRRDNAYLLSGYRRHSNSYLASLKSLFYLHNETVNIWTHVLGALAFPSIGIWLHGVVAPRYASASEVDVLVFACFFAGAVACLGMSATYHAVMNHSEGVAKWGNKLDYSGIVALIVGSYVPALYYALVCEPRLLTVYLYGIFLLGLGCGVVSWVEKFRTPNWRVYRTSMFVGLGVSGVVPICHGLVIYGYESLNEQMGLNWVLLEGFLYIFGAFLYAFRWPERSFPETFDIWGSSHQLFHVLILFAAASHLIGMAKAFDYHHSIMGAQC
ncbi:Uu.00g043300.m01.CDS01 [Anthostomella pinea]|uniref:Uu.00g043300.m01.CDS01 n=1 Tax=Anthostomella pinea TaxID=933095 RepID=A0AAI8VBF4_9PEZI|nr:Uu.00g043300.m01.CDS01 [Anthostomella pinea]